MATSVDQLIRVQRKDGQAHAREGGIFWWRHDEGGVTGHEEGARVGVVALVGCHDRGRVGVGPLHSLLHVAGRTGATVVAPA